MEKKICLKVCFHGEMQEFDCNADSSYEDVLALLILRYEIPTELQPGIMLTNSAGYRFDKQLFEYFILLFPAPQLVFHLRFNWQQLRREVQQIVGRHERNSNNNSNQANISQAAELQTSTVEYNAAPVRRQNCFMGVYPSNSFAEKESDNMLDEALTGQRSKPLQLMNTQARRCTKHTSTISMRAIRI